MGYKFKSKDEYYLSKIRKLKLENEKLIEFAIWMTGCGYDFTQHEYFCKNRDELLKGETNE